MSALIQISNGGWSITTGMKIDADGSPRVYGPNNTGLDFTANGGPLSDPYGFGLNPATGKPFIQGVDAPAFDPSTKGFYVSSTTYQRREFKANDPRRYLNAETEDFIVVSGSFRRQVSGIVIGCYCEVEYKGKIVVAIAGDVGPAFGEASISVAKKHGIPDSPRDGGVDSGVTYRVFPGRTVPGYELQAA